MDLTIGLLQSLIAKQLNKFRLKFEMLDTNKYTIIIKESKY
jgi:hypothetical protein